MSSKSLPVILTVLNRSSSFVARHHRIKRINLKCALSHENKKTLKSTLSRPMGVLHSFFYQKYFYDKVDLRLFYFCLTILLMMLQVKNQTYLKRKIIFLLYKRIVPASLIIFDKQNDCINVFKQWWT